MSDVWFAPQSLRGLDPKTEAYYHSLQELELRLELLAEECCTPRAETVNAEEDLLDLADYIVIDYSVL